MQSSCHSFFDRCSITTARGHSVCGASREEAGQHAIFKTFDVDLERVDMRCAGFFEDALQPQRRHPDRLARGFSRHDVAGAEIFAIGLDQQLAIGGTGGGRDQPHLGMA